MSSVEVQRPSVSETNTVLVERGVVEGLLNKHLPDRTRTFVVGSAIGAYLATYDIAVGGITGASLYLATRFLNSRIKYGEVFDS